MKAAMKVLLKISFLRFLYFEPIRIKKVAFYSANIFPHKTELAIDTLIKSEIELTSPAIHQPGTLEFRPSPSIKDAHFKHSNDNKSAEKTYTTKTPQKLLNCFCNFIVSLWIMRNVRCKMLSIIVFPQT